MNTKQGNFSYQYFFSTLLLVALCFTNNKVRAETNSSVDQLTIQLNQIPEHSQLRIPILVSLVKECWRACAPKAKTYGQNALKLLDKWPSIEQEAKLLVYLPRVYLRDALHQEAESLIKRGLEAAKQFGDEKVLASIQLNQAILYSDKFHFILAEKTYLQLLETYKRLNNADGIGTVLNNLGLINLRLHNYGKALKQYQQAIEVYLKAGVHHNAANTFGNIARIYQLSGDLKMAESSVKKGLKLVSVEKYPALYISINNRLAHVYKDKKEYEPAEKIFIHILDVAEKSEVRLAQAELYAELANVKLLQGQLKEANKYYQIGLEFNQSRTPPPRHKRLIEVGAKIKIANGDFAGAENLVGFIQDEVNNKKVTDSTLELLKLLIKIKQLQSDWQASSKLLSLYNDKYQEQVETNRKSRLEQFNVLYKANEQKQTIAELEQQNSLKTLEVLTEQTSRRQVIFVALLIATALFAFICVGYNKRKSLLLRTKLMQDAAKRKQQMFSDISHEFRTPLTALKLQLEGLEYGLVDDPNATYKLLHNKLASINHLICDISQLAQADSGDLSLSFEPINVKTYFEEWVSDVQPLPKSKGLNFSYELALREDTQCVLDSERIKQVLNNLISNSCRYTDAPGEIHFKASATENYLLCSIEDSSPGLPQAQLMQIFERLYRADMSSDREQCGTGLGLNISQSLVDAHNGCISAEHSELGGVRIKVKLPLVQESHPS